MGNSPQERNSSAPRTAQTIVRDYWPVIFAGLLFFVIQWPVLLNWWKLWEEKEGYYSHGFLVPFIAGFMLWTNRSKLARAEVRPSWIGLLLLLIFLPVHAIGLTMGLRVLYGLAFFLCIYGALLMLLGRQITRIAFIPVLFLLTMIPIASWMLDSATAQFQLISATVATKFLQLTAGHDITQYGNTIYSPGLPGEHTLLVGSPCSGLRLLISLITFSWFFVYVIDGAWWKKVFLLCMSFPLSIFINSFRVTMIGYVGFWTGSSEAMLKFHDYSGYIGLVICFVILFGIAKLIKAGDICTGKSPSESDSIVASWPKPLGGGVRGVLTLILFAIAALISNTVTPLYELPKGHIDRENIPMSLGQWEGRGVTINKDVMTILGQGDLMSRIYTDSLDTGRQVQVFVDASLDVSAFHDPHLCLPGNGSPVTKDRIITVSFDKPRPITVRATVLEASGDYGTTLVIYWYMLDDKSYPTTGDMLNANRRNKMDDLRRIVLAPWNIRQLRSDILSRQFVWYRFSTDAYGDQSDEKFLVEFIRNFVAHTKGFAE